MPLSRYRVVETLPPAPAAAIPEDLPPAVLRAFRDAEAAFLAGASLSALTSYRTSLERALKVMLAHSGRGRLVSLIDEAENQRQIPPALAGWAHHIRSIGNEAAHEADFDPEHADVAEVRAFAELFLTYAFSLPARLERAKDAREP